LCSDQDREVKEVTTVAQALAQTEVPQSALRLAEKNFSPAAVERDLYAWWEASGFFQPADGPNPFTIILPPPNVTGDLHVGHGFTFTQEDILVRWHRMLGDPTLFLPGSDHAGIAAHIVVERELAKEGLDRFRLGREKFVAEMWKWMEHYKPRMYAQMRAMGWSLDWTRTAFTMDPDKQRAVRTHFIRLYKEGHLYRADRIVHWCVKDQTTYSDLELEHVERVDTLWTVRYPFADGAPGGVLIATTRPETIVADVAVAVHPEDARWKGLLGREVLVPVIERRVPIVADEAVDPAFGTGAVKITPGHDATDFEIGQRHHLPIVSVIDTRGMMRPEAGPLAGLSREAARADMVQRLRKLGVVEKEEPLTHSVGRHDRCATIDEPLVLKQWWCSMSRLAPPAIQAVRERRVRIVPEGFEKTYFQWMEKIRDWNISRQIWWGHQVPAWFCRDCDQVIVPDEDAPDPARCPRCDSTDIRQDPDVLDTWFSSALWPHTTLGWPERTADLARFYPTSVLNTAYEILFFWVARMIVMGLHNLGAVPFRVVFVNGIVRVGTEKMSKSKGNVVDPSQMVNDYGADATRFGLIAGVAPGADSQISPAKMDRARNFVNKVWNAGRFVLGALDGAAGLRADARPAGELSLADRWILSRTDAAVAEASELLQRFETGEYAALCERYVWSELADWYLEAAKPRAKAGLRPTLATLAYTLDRTLRLLHPLMPFVSETLAQQLWLKAPAAAESRSLMLAKWPRGGRPDEEAERRFGLVMAVVRAIRNLRQEQGIAPNHTIEAQVDGARDTLEPERELVERLASCGLSFGRGEGMATVVRGVSVRVKLPAIDGAAARARLERELAEAREQLRRTEELLARPSFIARARPEAVEKERERLAARRLQVAKLEEDLGRL
jgi:valyl-tRNA synthetase